jgi:hypothetical protein
MGQPLLDQGADAHDIMPPTPEELPPDMDAPFEVRHATRARRIPRAPRAPHLPPLAWATAGARPRSPVAPPAFLVARADDADPTRSDRLPPRSQSPNHATKKWLRRNSHGTRPSSFRRSAGGAKEFSYADQMRIEALQEYQRRLAEPVNLSNEVLIDFSSRMLAELDMRPYKTSLALYAKTFTADEFIEWAMTQPEVRDQCDALFIGSELLCRAVFAPVSYSRADALFYAPTLRPGNGAYRLVAKKKAEVVAAIFGKAAVSLSVDVPEGSGTASAQVSPGGTASDGGLAGVSKSSTFGAEKEKAAPKSGRAPKKGILKNRRSSRLGDIAEFEEYRRFKFLPRFARLAAFKARAAARRRTRALGKAYRRTMHSAYAPARAARGWLGTRLGPHALFATMAPLLLLHLFAEHVVAVVCFAWWCWRHVARADARQRRDLERRVRAEELARFQGRRGYAKLHKDGSETADWWSEVLRSFWDGWIEFWLNRLLTRVLTNVLARVKPAYLESLEITTFKLGDAPPRINSSRCWRGNEGETILEWDLVWETKQMNITLSAKVGGSKFAVPVPLRVYVSDLRIAGKFRLGLFWTRRKGGPYLRRLRVSFVDVPEHSVVIKPMTSSFIDVRDLPGVDSAIENALNKLFTNVLVEPNCVNWDVEKWWINRPAAQPPRAGALGPDSRGGSMTAEDQQVVLEAERIQSAKGSSVSSMLAAGAGYSRKPTLSVSVSVHLAEVETREDAAPTSYYVKIKRGAKKFTTEGAKAVPSETLVSSGAGDSHGRFGSQGGASSRGSSIGGESDDGGGAGRARELFHDARENAHARSASAAVPGSASSHASAGLTSPGGGAPFLSPKSAGDTSVGHGRRVQRLPGGLRGGFRGEEVDVPPGVGGIRAPGRIRQARRRRRARARVGGVARARLAEQERAGAGRHSRRPGVRGRAPAHRAAAAGAPAQRRRGGRDPPARALHAAQRARRRRRQGLQPGRVTAHGAVHVHQAVRAERGGCLGERRLRRGRRRARRPRHHQPHPEEVRGRRGERHIARRARRGERAGAARPLGLPLDVQGVREDVHGQGGVPGAEEGEGYAGAGGGEAGRGVLRGVAGERAGEGDGAEPPGARAPEPARRAAAARERRRGERARDAPRETLFGARGRVPERGLARGGRARRDGHGARR